MYTAPPIHKIFGLHTGPLKKRITAYGFIENDSDLTHGLREFEGTLAG